MTPGENPDGLIGSVVQGRYRVLSKIGQGGMGSVYVAEHLLIGRRFALKTLRAELAHKPEVIARFYREARAAAALGDEHIVEVSDMGHLPDGSPFIVMELLEGRDLGAVLEREGSLAVGRAVRIVQQCCSALARAHERGIIHRDIKPDNIFLTTKKGQNDFVKLVDFGISKVQQEAIALDSFSSITTTGVAVGTPLYMSPEQLREAAVDHRTDVYGLGVVLFQSLTGRVPFDAGSYPALVTKILHEPPPMADTLRADLPRDLVLVISRMLAKEPQQRFASMRAVSAALAPFENATSESARPSRKPTPRVATPGAWESHSDRSLRSAVSRRSLWIRAGVGAAVALCGMVWLAVKSSDEPPGVAPRIVHAGSSGSSASALPQSVTKAAPLVVAPPDPAPSPTPSRPVEAKMTAPAKASTQSPDATGVVAQGRRSSKRLRELPQAKSQPEDERSLSGAARQPAAESVDQASSKANPSATPLEAHRSETRPVTLRNASPTAVTVELECGGFVSTRTIAAGAGDLLLVRDIMCRVQCAGTGQPRCPSVLAPSARSLTIN